MMMQLISELLSTGLKIWEHKLKNKYFEEWRELTTSLKDEEDKTIEYRNQAKIDNLHFKLLQLAKRFNADVNESQKIKEEKNEKNK